MSRNPSCTVYIGNLDEKVSEKVLYEILIQVGRIVDLYIPRDKETNRHKGYAFAEFESEQIANYAVRLFSGLVRLYNRTLKFAISGQDKPSQNFAPSVTPNPNSHLPRLHTTTPVRDSDLPQAPAPVQSIIDHRVSTPSDFMSPNYPQASTHGYVNNGFNGANNFEYSRRVFGSVLTSINRPDPRQPIAYSSS